MNIIYIARLYYGTSDPQVYVSVVVSIFTIVELQCENYFGSIYWYLETLQKGDFLAAPQGY